MKTNLSIFFSVIALLGVLTLSALWVCDVWRFSVVSLDSFVGVIVALLGLLITFAIGWQIINAMDIREKLKEIETIRRDVKKQQKNIADLALETKSESTFILANTAYSSKDYVNAFRFAQAALWAHLQCDNIINHETMLLIIERSNSNLAQGIDIPWDNYDSIKNVDLMIRELKNYPIIAGRYDKAYSAFIQKTVRSTKSSHES